MKCKLSKLFFLTLVGAMTVNVQAQTDEEMKNISSGYDLKMSERLGAELKKKYEESYAKGLQIVKEKGLPVSGITPEGNVFSLKGVDSETGDVIYYQSFNNSSTDSSRQTARAQHLYSGGSLGINIQGSGMRLGIWDGGQPQANHENLGVTRTINKDADLEISGDAETRQGGRNHATHVAGTMIGNGPVSKAKGIAFDGIVWSNTWENDNVEMRQQASAGLLVSNHSYGIGNSSYVNNPSIFGRYDSSARDIDELLFIHDKYQPSYAAGNDRDGVSGMPSGTLLNTSKLGFDQLKNESVAKNTVVVGAIYGFTDYTGATDVRMTTFSQWGPTDDFRVKPDIVAKGYDVYSSSFPTADSRNKYNSYPGTSMATPSVTAVFALWQQYSKVLWPFGLKDQSLTDTYLYSSTIRALMAHTASPARERNDNYSDGPNARFGWGVINAEGGAKVMKDAKQGRAVLKEIELQNGQVYELNVILDGTAPLTATIAWTDKQGEDVSIEDSRNSVLVNDLDLRVVRPNGSILMPWSLAKTSMINPRPVRDVDNNVDNIEKIDFTIDLLGGAPAGEYKIKVSHKGVLDSGMQRFSLVVSGGVVSFSEPSLGTDDFEISNLKLYPNPANDILNISADFNSIENASLKMFDLLGKLVYENDTLFKFSSDATINVSSFSPGVYMLQLSKDGKVDTRKVVVK